MAMGRKIITGDNLKKTIRYLKKNGISHAYYAARERIEEEKRDHYEYKEPSEDVLRAQRQESAPYPDLFSIVVPAYETGEAYLRAMIDSVRRQSYEKWELLIMDAGSSGSVEKAVGQILEETGDARIKYRHLRENKGISDNTNAGIALAEGDYIALLDHDDLLTPDALYHMAAALQEARARGRMPALLYSDEDKYEDNRGYTQPHRKENFNLDLILSNNYICHFMAVEAALMKRLKLRAEYDGAQDYDLVLRVVDHVYKMTPVQDFMHELVHIPRVLYHWRCHAQSTAQNTASKSYAYEAGRAAVEDFCRRRGWQVNVSHGLHLGFYEIEYLPDLLSVRREAGIVGGRLLDRHGRICGGAYREDGSRMYEGLPGKYSGGSTHRAVLKQDVFAVDIRCMRVAPPLWKRYEEITGLPYRERTVRGRHGRGCAEYRTADLSGLSCDEAGYRKLGMELGRAAAAEGYLVIWNPGVTGDP